MAGMIKIEVELEEEEAVALAEFLRRVQPEDYERRAGDADEAYHARFAGVAIQQALRKKGFTAQ